MINSKRKHSQPCWWTTNIIKFPSHTLEVHPVWWCSREHTHASPSQHSICQRVRPRKTDLNCHINGLFPTDLSVAGNSSGRRHRHLRMLLNTESLHPWERRHFKINFFVVSLAVEQSDITYFQGATSTKCIL